MIWPPDARNWLIGKDPDAGRDQRKEEKGMTEGKMVGWYHRLNGHEFESTLGVGDGQGGLEYCSPRGHRVGHDWATELNWIYNPRLQKSSSGFTFTLLQCFLFYLASHRLNPRHGWPDLQGLEDFKTCSLSYLQCSLTCCACRQARNPGKVQAG